MHVRFWGTRGSIATPGPDTLRFGGNTSCVEVTTSAGACFILDCGTGARALGAALMARGPKPLTATILLSHNVNPKVVSEMLGHSSVAITLDIYSHVLPHMQHDAAATMAQALFGSSEGIATVTHEEAGL